MRNTTPRSPLSGASDYGDRTRPTLGAEYKYRGTFFLKTKRPRGTAGKSIWDPGFPLGGCILGPARERRDFSSRGSPVLLPSGSLFTFRRRGALQSAFYSSLDASSPAPVPFEGRELPFRYSRY